MDVNHLRAILAVSRTGSLTAAARELHCTQSALSHLLNDLEGAIGTRLLERDRRPVALTTAGERVRACATSVLPQMATLMEDLARLRDGATGRLLISLECHSCIEWLAPAMAAYRSAHPLIDLDLRMGANFDPLPSLTAGAVDLVITSERSSAQGVLSDPLFRTTLMPRAVVQMIRSGEKSGRLGDVLTAISRIEYSGGLDGEKQWRESWNVRS